MKQRMDRSPSVKDVVRTVVILLLMLAVIIYTLYNYVAGNSEFGYFFIAMVMMGLPFVSMLNQLIQQLKNK
jgi:uncharacterized membrane protein YiaA